MKRFLYLLVVLAVAHSAPGAERQLGFASALFDGGDEVFALLEYQRFLFHHPGHAGVPDARLRLARLQISAAGNPGAALANARLVLADHPQAPQAKTARELVEFIEVNSDFDGSPLQLWFRAENSEERGQFEVAAALFGRLADDFPGARLADDALFRVARIQHESLGQTEAARATLARLAENYPNSNLLVEAEFLAAQALADGEGKEAEGAQALRRFAARHPESPLAKQAIERAVALERRGFAFERRFDPDFVRPYTVRQAAREKDGYRCDIQVAPGLSQREIQATLEDALATESAKRAQPGDPVVVQAYFNYPVTRAGRASWTPGKEPEYQIERRQTRDLLLDFGLDILRQP